MKMDKKVIAVASGFLASMLVAGLFMGPEFVFKTLVFAASSCGAFAALEWFNKKDKK